MTQKIILASASSVRATLLHNASVDFDVVVPRIDEAEIKRSLLAENASPKDIADTLAELKAAKISQKHPDALVIGCDQVLELKGKMVSKHSSPNEAFQQLVAMQNTTHRLLSAAVVYQDCAPIWRHIGTVRLTMHSHADDWLKDYVDRNWLSIKHAVGAYKLEEEGVRLFSKIEGDYFTVLGLPLLELLSYLKQSGKLD